MCDAYAWAQKTSNCVEKASKAGFSEPLNELINDQEEAVFMIDESDGVYKISGYTLPRKGNVFQGGEVRNAFLAQSMMSPKFKDKDRVVLSKYLDRRAMRANSESQLQLTRGSYMSEDMRSVYKYKPVALKVNPMMKELPAEFRIKREILGDPLAEMPELSPNPPDFVLTGRYTQERKNHFDKVYKGDFLLAEE